MSFDAFTARLGEQQGRVVAPDGSVVFVLGEFDAGRFARLLPGDRVEVVQPLDVTGIALVRATLTLQARSLPPDRVWEASVLVDGVKRAATRCGAWRTRRTADLAANVSKLNGLHDVGVRLELVTV